MHPILLSEVSASRRNVLLLLLGAVTAILAGCDRVDGDGGQAPGPPGVVPRQLKETPEGTKPAVVQPAGNLPSPRKSSVSASSPQSKNAPSGGNRPADKMQQAVDQIRRTGALVTAAPNGGAIIQIMAGPEDAYPVPKISDDDVALMAKMPDLFFLKLNKTGITDASILKLASLQKLNWLDISGNPITDKGFEKLKDIPSLDVINFSGTKVTDSAACFLKHSRVRIIQANDTSLSDEGVKCLGNIRSLMNLQLSGTGITDTGLAALTPLKGLRELTLAKTAIDDVGLLSLAQFRRLRELDLSGCPINGSGIIALAPLPLVWLKLNNTLLSDDAIPALSSMRKEIIAIELHGTKISPAGIARLKEALPNTSIRTR